MEQASNPSLKLHFGNDEMMRIERVPLEVEDVEVNVQR